MNTNDLLKLLDLGGREAARDPTSPPILLSENGSIPTQPSSQTALVLDDWACRKGADLLAESDRLQTLSLDSHAIADFFAASFETSPQFASNPSDALRAAFLQQLFETPEYRSLHTATRLQEIPSAIATVALADRFAQLRDRLRPGSVPNTSPDHSDRELETLRAVGKAVSDAESAVSECLETSAAFGMGTGTSGSNDSHAIAKLFRRVRSSAVLRRIVEQAGRLRRLAQSKQRDKVSHGLDEVVGIVPDADLSRLLSSELAQLALPERELDLLRRFLERQTLCRELRAVEPVGLGPIVIVVDESGSMRGSKVETAKALAMALAWIARRQQRWVCWIAYSGSSGERLLALPPGRWEEHAIADWLEGFLGYGSDLDVPIRELPSYLDRLRAPMGKTDVLFLTDALCRIPAEVGKAFLAWKVQRRVRAIGLVIGSPPGDLAQVVDEVHRVSTLTADSEAVGRVLSL